MFSANSLFIHCLLKFIHSFNFEALANRTEKENLTDAVQKAVQEAKRSSAQRLHSRESNALPKPEIHEVNGIARYNSK